MSFYPPKIDERFQNLRRAGKTSSANAVGTGASFVCGAVARILLRIEPETKRIVKAGFQTSGCGYAAAAADCLIEYLEGGDLKEFHGIDDSKLLRLIENTLGAFPSGREHCAEICIEAVQAALKDFRRRQIDEFQGEKALVCTCFGVSEETVERLIAEADAETTEEVGELCRAGTGCGACRFLIQELIDTRAREF